MPTKHQNDVTSTIIESSTGWDEAGDYGDIQFYDAVLAINTRKFKKGDKVSTVTFLLNQSKCQIYQKSGPSVDGFTPEKVVEEFGIKLVPNFN